MLHPSTGLLKNLKTAESPSTAHGKRKSCMHAYEICPNKPIISLWSARVITVETWIYLRCRVCAAEMFNQKALTHWQDQVSKGFGALTAEGVDLTTSLSIRREWPRHMRTWTSSPEAKL